MKQLQRLIPPTAALLLSLVLAADTVPTFYNPYAEVVEKANILVAALLGVLIFLVRAKPKHLGQWFVAVFTGLAVAYYFAVPVATYFKLPTEFIEPLAFLMGLLSKYIVELVIQRAQEGRIPLIGKESAEPPPPAEPVEEEAEQPKKEGDTNVQ